jgi:hypothetical protein
MAWVISSASVSRWRLCWLSRKLHNVKLKIHLRGRRDFTSKPHRANQITSWPRQCPMLKPPSSNLHIRPLRIIKSLSGRRVFVRSMSHSRWRPDVTSSYEVTSWLILALLPAKLFPHNRDLPVGGAWSDANSEFIPHGLLGYVKLVT